MEGHLDSANWEDNGANLTTNSPGADDSAASVAAVLETARILAKYKFEDTLKFALFNVEEVPITPYLLGSHYYIENASARGENIVFAFCSDNMGYSTGSNFFDILFTYYDMGLAQAAYMDNVNDRYSIGLIPAYYSTTNWIPSDVQSFRDFGYPGILVHEVVPNPNTHHPTDTVDNLNMTLVTKVTKLAVATLAEAAHILYIDVDVKGTDLNVSNSDPSVGEQIQLNATLKNTGNLNATNVMVDFLLDGVPLESKRIWVSAEGSNRTGVFWNATSGNHTFSVVLDPANEFLETDESNNAANTSFAVNDRPVAVLVPSAPTVSTNEPVKLNGSLSSDIVGGIASYKFEFGDGQGSGWVGSATATHSYSDEGDFIVNLTVRDQAGSISIPVNVTIKVLNRRPSASPTSSSTTTLTFEAIQFMANANDTDGTMTISWDMGDGHITDETDPIYSYSNSGNYEVQLDVTDDDGAVSSYSLNISVLDRPPECSIEAQTTTGNISHVFSLAGSGKDLDGSIITYSWDLGDGSIAEGEAIEHKYAKPGTYVVTLTVTDDDGMKNQTSLSITIVDTPPRAEGMCDPCETNPTNEISFDANGTSDLEGPVTLVWDFGDGNASTLPSPRHSYARAGTYTVRLMVMDDSGQNVSISIIVEVLNRSPTAGFYVHGNLVVGNSLVFDASNSSDPDGPLTYEWSFGDGQNGYGLVVDHVYKNAMEYDVTLTVTDADGEKVTTSQKVKVTSVKTDNGAMAKGSEDMTIMGLSMLVAILALMLIMVILWTARSGKKGQGERAEPEKRRRTAK